MLCCRLMAFTTMQTCMHNIIHVICCAYFCFRSSEGDAEGVREDCDGEGGRREGEEGPGAAGACR